MQAHIVSSIPNDGYACWPSIRINGALCTGPIVNPPIDCDEAGDLVNFLDNTAVRKILRQRREHRVVGLCQPLIREAASDVRQ